MLHFLLTSVAAPVAVAIATTWFLNVRRISPTVESHRRRVADLNEDLRRWIRDRDQMLDWQLREILNVVTPMPSGRTAWQIAVSATSIQRPTGSTLERRARAKELALQEYRDEVSRKLREFDDLAAEQTRLHRWLRRRRRIELRVWVPDDAAARLARWRADEERRDKTGAAVETVAVVDPTANNLEPRIRELEEKGLSI